MKTLLGLTLSLFLVSTTVHADDTDASAEKQVEHKTSKNPITGTVTKTKKLHKKQKNAATTAETDVTQKTKFETDGDVKKSTDVEKSVEPNK